MFRVSLRNLDRYLRSEHTTVITNLRFLNSNPVFCRQKIFIGKARSNLCNVKSNFLSQSRSMKTFLDQQGVVNRKYLLWSVYGSMGVGIVMLSFIAYTHFKRRRKGIEDLRLSNGRKIKHLIQYRGVILPKFTEPVLEKIENFEVRNDDIWVVSFPRSGTTWTQEIVYLITSNMNIEKAKTTSIDDRFPYLEYLTPGLEAIDKMPSPRLIKTHMPLRLLPKDITKAKVVYVARNPKDTVVSYYHFCKLLKSFDGDFDEFLAQFVNNRVGYSPWWQHVLDFWNVREDPNVLFLTYEDMCQDLEGSIRKIAEFLGKSLTDKDVKYIAHHCSFDEMKNNEQVNYEWMRNLGIWDNKDSENTFLRKGKIGEWRNHFTSETNFSMNRMVAYKLKDSGLHFKYDKDQVETGKSLTPS